MIREKVSLLSRAITDKITLSEERLHKAKRLRKVGPEAQGLLENQIQTLYWAQNKIDEILGDVDADNTETRNTGPELQTEEAGPTVLTGTKYSLSEMSTIS
jgi:hypothetical protein